MYVNRFTSGHGMARLRGNGLWQHYNTYVQAGSVYVDIHSLTSHLDQSLNRRRCMLAPCWTEVSRTTDRPACNPHSKGLLQNQGPGLGSQGCGLQSPSTLDSPVGLGPQLPAFARRRCDWDGRPRVVQLTSTAYAVMAFFGHSAILKVPHTGRA